jgi:hypothetical protein
MKMRIEPLSNDEWFNLTLTIGRHKKERHLKPLIVVDYLNRCFESGFSKLEIADRANCSQDQISKFRRLNDIKSDVIRNAIDWNGNTDEGCIPPSIGWELAVLPAVYHEAVFNAVLDKSLTSKEVINIVSFFNKNADISIHESIQRIVDFRPKIVETNVIMGKITSESLRVALTRKTPVERNLLMKNLLSTEYADLTFTGFKLKPEIFIIVGTSETERMLSNIKDGFENAISLGLKHLLEI